MITEEIRRYHERAMSYIAIHNFELAMDDVDRLIRIAPTWAEAEYLKGIVLFEKKNIAASVQWLSSAFYRKPETGKYASYLLDVLVKSGQISGAKRLLKKLRSHSSWQPECLFSVGLNSLALKEYRVALLFFESSLNRQPDSVQSLFQIGVCHLRLNQFTQATEFFEQCIEVDESFAQAYWMLSQHYPENFSIVRIEKLLCLFQLSHDTQDKIWICFTLGAIFDHREQYQDAYHWFELGNQLSRKTLQYSVLKDIQLMKQIRSGFLISEKKYLESETGRFDSIMIFGLPCSGVEVLRRMVSTFESMDELSGQMTLDYFAKESQLQWMQRYRQRPVNDILSQISFTEIGHQYQEYLKEYSGASTIKADISSNNGLYIGYFLRCFTQLKCIYIKRNLIDIVFENYCRHFDDHPFYVNNIDELVQYCYHYQELMSYWSKRFPEQFLVIEFEELQMSATAWLSVFKNLANNEFEFNQLCNEMTQQKNNSSDFHFSHSKLEFRLSSCKYYEKFKESYYCALEKCKSHRLSS